MTDLAQQTREKLSQIENPPRWIAVEGAIGVGKTTLCRKLAQTLNYDILLEKAEENPFLSKFYQQPRQHALATQLFFLMQRAEQLNNIGQSDMFAPIKVADFLLEKDKIFAELTLSNDELKLYMQVYEHIEISKPKPDLVIYLQAPVPVLQSRIRKRGIASEQSMEDTYLEALNEAYSRFFHYYEESPLLIVNAAEIDLVNNDSDYKLLIDHILSTQHGRHFLNPQPMLA